MSVAEGAKVFIEGQGPWGAVVVCLYKVRPVVQSG